MDYGFSRYISISFNIISQTAAFCKSFQRKSKTKKADKIVEIQQFSAREQKSSSPWGAAVITSENINGETADVAEEFHLDSECVVRRYLVP